MTLISLVSGLLVLCATATATAQEAEDRPLMPPVRVAGEVRLDSAAIHRKVAEGALAPLPDAVRKHRGSDTHTTPWGQGE